MNFSLEETFGAAAVEYARSYMENYEYSDRLRMAFNGDESSESNYFNIRARGCCGFVDFVQIPRFLVKGKIDAYFGFNYGH